MEKRELMKKKRFSNLLINMGSLKAKLLRGMFLKKIFCKSKYLFIKLDQIF